MPLLELLTSRTKKVQWQGLGSIERPRLTSGKYNSRLSLAGEVQPHTSPV
jgi:hypothetical protein